MSARLRIQFAYIYDIVTRRCKSKNYQFRNVPITFRGHPVAYIVNISKLYLQSALIARHYYIFLFDFNQRALRLFAWCWSLRFSRENHTSITKEKSFTPRLLFYRWSSGDSNTGSFRSRDSSGQARRKNVEIHTARDTFLTRRFLQCKVKSAGICIKIVRREFILDSERLNKSDRPCCRAPAAYAYHVAYAVNYREV